MVNEAVAGWGPDQMRSLWKEFGTLAGAVKEITRTGNAGQMEAATTVLASTRRKLYGLLAADEDAEDVHNGDDLR